MPDHPDSDWRPSEVNANLSPRIAIVGAGFAGLGMAIRLGQAGFRDFTLFEAGPEVGGTWRDNTYPGCACDIPSHLYSFSFESNPEWTRMYPWHDEIQAYLVRCAERYALRPRIRLDTKVESMRFDSERCLWSLRTSRAETIEADVVVVATGPLSRPRTPDIRGLGAFEGTVFHTARWRHDHDLGGRRVAVVGTGASAIQVIPEIAPLVDRLLVFQRTPPWIVPRPDRRFGRLERGLLRGLPPLRRLYRAAVYVNQEARALAFLGNRPAARLAAWTSRRFLARSVRDPELRRKLTPRYAMGCKRVLVSNDYYPALQRPNVDLVTEPITEVARRSIATADGREREVDTIVLATGFSVTDFPGPLAITGRDGRELKEAWAGGAATHLGITVAGFPNMFWLVGPGTGLGHNSIVLMIEAQVGYVVRALRGLPRGRALDVRPEVQEAWYREVQKRMRGTVWLSGCRSWYLSPDGRNDTLWPGFTFEYWWRTRRYRDEEHTLLSAADGPRA